MRHFGKRAFALILALMLCLSLFPSALAEDAGSIAAAEDAPEQEITIAPEEEGDIIPAEEGIIAPADEGSIRPAEEGDALPRTDETQDGATSGQCGDDLSWSFDESSGTLTITGSGDMWNWDYPAQVAPWYSLRGSIKSVELPRGLTSIGGEAFQQCNSLTSITIPESVISIGDNAFSVCSSLTSITIPESITSIADGTFSNCNSLTSISIPESVTSIGNYAFSGCGFTEIKIPSSVTSIGGMAFYCCHSLTSITIPEGVSTIGNNAFFECGGLMTIDVEEGNTVYSSLNGVLFSKDTTVLLTFPGGRSGGYGIPAGVIGIGDHAFESCGSLTNVTIPESVISIGSWAFSDCSSLTEITIPEGITGIAKCTFYCCRSLSNITIPESVTSIGDFAFSFCSGLTSITIPERVTSIGDDAFQQCSSLTEVRFSGLSPTFGDYVFGGVTATAYYPSKDPSWTESSRQGYGGVITWEPYLPTESTLSLGDATACAGKAFTVDLTLDENPGIMGLSFQLDYDSSVMEFVGAEDGVLTGWTVNVKKNILVWDDDWEHTDTGCLLKLKFRLQEDAALGETRIGLTDLTVGNYNEDNLYLQVRSGRVTVLVHRPGDANGDGKVNVNDLIRLRKYLAGMEKEIIAGNADVNADEIVDILDLVRLRKYIAQMDGVILE